MGFEIGFKIGFKIRFEIRFEIESKMPKETKNQKGKRVGFFSSQKWTI